MYCVYYPVRLVLCGIVGYCPVWDEPPKWIPDDLCRLVLIKTWLSIYLDYLIKNYSPQAPWIVGNRGIKDKRYIPCHLSLVLSISLFMWRFQILFWFCLKHATRDWLVRLVACRANYNDSRLNTNVLDVAYKYSRLSSLDIQTTMAFRSLNWKRVGSYNTGCPVTAAINTSADILFSEWIKVGRNQSACRCSLGSTQAKSVYIPIGCQCLAAEARHSHLHKVKKFSTSFWRSGRSTLAAGSVGRFGRSGRSCP